MPATERPFTAIPPAHLYLDTNVCLDYLVNTRPYHARAQALFAHVVAHGITALCISSLSWLEFAHVIAKANFRDALPVATHRQFQLDKWDDPTVREVYVVTFLGHFQALLDQFGWQEVFVTLDVRRQALRLNAQYNLGPHDAAHLACAQEAGVIDLASFDKGFRRVEGLYLWNDLIHRSSIP